MLRKISLHAVARPFYEGGIETSRNAHQKHTLHTSLSLLLADVYGLYQQCLYYYWNVVGDEHLGLDELFEKQYESLQTIGAQLSERLEMIGQPATTFPDHLYLPSFPDNRKAVTSVRNMLTNVLKGHESCSKQALSALELAEDLEDQKTASLLLQTMLLHDKSIWMIKSLCS